MKRRHKRIGFIVAGLSGLAIAAALVLSAFQENLVFFFSPSQVAAKEAPHWPDLQSWWPGTRGHGSTRKRWTHGSLCRDRYGAKHSRGLQGNTSRPL